MEKRLEKAIAKLQAGHLSCVIYFENKEPVCSEAIGIKPLMIELRKNRQAFRHGVIADKVVGKAAALMAVLGQADAVYGEIMSEAALTVFEKNHIDYRCGTLVPFIENRTHDGKCPMEAAVWEVDNPTEAFVVLEKTIAKLMQATPFKN